MRAKQEADLLFLYNVSRPAQKAFYRAKTMTKDGTLKEEEVAIESPGPATTRPEPVSPVKPVAVIKVQKPSPKPTNKTQPKPAVIPEVKAQFYNHGIEEEEYYAEFDSPNVYENEETGRAPAIAEYHGPEDEVDYDNLKDESNVYVYKL